jgi:hypothetical protein
MACQDGNRASPSISGPALDISEARFGSGNQDFFFSTPLAAAPKPGDPNFDPGGSNGALRPYVRVCETNGAESPAGCVQDVTSDVTGSPTGLLMSYTSSSELYQVNWKTTRLNTAKSYRIEVWGLAFSTAAEKAALDPRWLFGWRDIRNSPSVSACKGTEEFCFLKYGQNLPVKVRIEQFVFCPVARNCSVQFVSAGTDANLQAELDEGTGAPSAQLFIPGQGGTDFPLAFEPCTTEEDAALSDAIDLPTFGPCLKTTTPFTGRLGTPAIVSLCSQLDPSGFGLPPEQLEQLALHHFTDDLSRAQALPEAWQCGVPTSGVIASTGPSQTFLHLARFVGEKVRSWVTPRLLMARAPMIDRGGGGATSAIESRFKLALPAKFVRGSPAAQSAPVGSDVTLTAKVTDLFGGAVANARVHWTFQVPPQSVGGDACVLAGGPGSACAPGDIVAYTDATGEARANVRLSTTAGDNVFHARGRGIADDRESGCTIQGGDAPCNGPRTGPPYGPFDPFMPFHDGDVFNGGPPTGPEYAVEVSNGTRLPFTITGSTCALGRGTATVDGNFTDAEWQCARRYDFTPNLPEGEATTATLYEMNDGTNVYFAVRFQQSGLADEDGLRLIFDNNDSWNPPAGEFEPGDDVLYVDVRGFTDKFCTEGNGTEQYCWAHDADSGGTSDGAGALRNDGGYTTYELSHPLNSADDAHDFSLNAGDKVGLLLILQTGSRFTRWPLSQEHLEIQILP